VDPEDEIRSTLSKFFAEGAGNEFWSGHEGYLGLETAGPMLIFSLLILLCIFRISPRPCPAVALFCGCLILYFLARAYAFRLLYIPHRYLSYGISATGLMLIVYALGLVGDRISDVRMRAAVRNIVVAAAIGIGVFLTGDHLKAKASIIIDGHVHEPLWEYMSNLPRDIKVAAHPIDASGISFWTGRAATPGVEQLLPWFDEAWKRNKAKAEDSLRLVYAMSADDVFTICEKEGITHILLNTKRYAENFGEKSMTFEPLTGFTLELLKDVDLADLVFSNPPAEASLVKHREYNLIDVSLLRKAWAEPGE
jgi:hypothetical protein